MEELGLDFVGEGPACWFRRGVERCPTAAVAHDRTRTGNIHQKGQTGYTTPGYSVASEAYACEGGSSG